VLIDGQEVRDVYNPNPAYPVQAPVPTEWTDVHGHRAGGYWLLGAQNPYAVEGAEQVFGGSPVDPRAVDRWRAYAADLRADQINTPLLIQGAENNSLANLELRAYLRARDVPVELVSYPGETHTFHRVAAMNRSLDWFDRWLAG
jgi:acetyl esterase/lipase